MFTTKNKNQQLNSAKLHRVCDNFCTNFNKFQTVGVKIMNRSDKQKSYEYIQLFIEVFYLVEIAYT